MQGFLPYLISGFLLIGLFYEGWRRLQNHREQQRKMQREFAALQQEKKIIYDFIHDLGEAFTEEIDRDHLLRIIVTCAQKVTAARGAAIYLWDEGREKLRLASLSGFFPPPLKMDSVVADQLAAHAEDLESFLRLESIPAGSKSAIAQVAQTGVPLYAESTDLDERFPWFRQKNLQTETYLAVPLHYRQDRLGVLALANQENGGPFTRADFDLVQSVADQAAFSLQHAQVFQQLAEKRRLDHEIEVAREIQRVLLPSQAPKIPGYSCAALNIPALQVSGDYYDFIRVDEEHWGVAVADVSGKGVPASLIMAICRSVLRSVAPGKASAAQVLREVNRQLYPDIREDMFITMLYLVLDTFGNVTFARAGHESPLIWRAAAGKVETVQVPGMALGIDAGDVFDEVIRDVTVPLASLDTVMIYTDGINEALDDHGNEFGLEELKAALRAAGSGSVEFLVKSVVKRVQDFSSGHAQGDDITLAAVQRLE